MWDDEWSGVLFYTENGKLEDEEFTLDAKYLVLMDIGSKAHTEYEFGPEYAQILMDNPDLMDMKMGHIHSHNTFEPFFSGEDDSELCDNAQFHNYYLSLIVNNKNNMVARLAYHVKVQSKITSIYTHRDTDGKEVSMEIPAEREYGLLYYYDCNVIRPVSVDDVLFDSYQKAIAIKNERVAKAKVAADEARAKVKSYTPGSYVPPTQLYLNYNKNTTQEATRNKQLTKKERKQLRKLEEATRNNKVSSAIISSIDPDVYSMMVKWLSQDFVMEDTLPKVMESISGSTVAEVDMQMYLEHVMENIEDYYMDAYPNDIELHMFEKTVDKIVEALKCYGHIYPKLVSKLITTLRKENKLV